MLQTDVFTRGFQPWREEETEVVLADGLILQGRVWMPLLRESLEQGLVDGILTGYTIFNQRTVTSRQS